jgi:hypothetical protein
MIRRIRVTFETDIDADVPGAATIDQIDEWVCYELHQRSEIQLSNPLSDNEIQGRMVQWRLI